MERLERLEQQGTEPRVERLEPLEESLVAEVVAEQLDDVNYSKCNYSKSINCFIRVNYSLFPTCDAI